MEEKETEKMSKTATQAHPLLSASVRVPNDVVFRDFSSETVVLNLQTGQYHGLNRTAGEMLTALKETGSVTAAAELIAERHGVDLAMVQGDVCSLCERLSERGLVSIEPGQST